MNKKPIIIGLTGSIATGKTTLSRFLRKINFPVFDADGQVKEILQTHLPTLKKIYRYWPFCFEGASFHLNKKKLAHHVFSQLSDLTILENLLHPQIKQRQKQFIDHFKESSYIIIESPLLFETQTNTICDMIVVTTCTGLVQKQRVLKRPGMTELLYQQINARQMPDEEKQQYADVIIDTTQGLQDTVKKIRFLLKECPLEKIKNKL